MIFGADKIRDAHPTGHNNYGIIREIRDQTH